MAALPFLLAAIFLDLFGLGLIRPVLPLFVQSVFGASIVQVSWIPAAFGIGKLLADLPAGLLMDRMGRARLMAAGLLLVATVDVLSAVELHFSRFLVLRWLAGLGFGFFVTTAAAAVLDVAPAAGRGRYVGWYLLVGDLGAVLGASAGGWMYEDAGVRAPFFAKALVAGMGALVVASAPLHGSRRDEPGAGMAARAVRLPDLIRISVVNMVLFMADVGILAVLLPLFLGARGLSPQGIGLFVALVAAAQIAALFVGSRLADRWGRIAVLAPALLVYAGGLLALSAGAGPWQFVLATLTIGAGSGAARAVPGALVGDLAPAPLRGVVMGVFRTFTDVGMIAGPVLLGWSASVAGFTIAFWTAAAGLVLAIPLLVGIRRVA
ncbi:MAG: MFS transporter [Armatimonadota bacterium]